MAKRKEKTYWAEYIKGKLSINSFRGRVNVYKTKREAKRFLDSPDVRKVRIVEVKK